MEEPNAELTEEAEPEAAQAAPPEAAGDPEAVEPAEATAEPELDAPEAEVKPEPGDLPPPGPDLSRIRGDLAALGERLDVLDVMAKQVAELSRLRASDTAMIDRLHAEITRLRAGELTQAFAPLLSGLLRLHDKMASLAQGDDNSIAGILRVQLLQLLDTSAAVQTYTPQPGEAFDTQRHSGAGRVLVKDPALDNTVARTLRPGFQRTDSTVVRVAEVEVCRLDPATAKAAAPPPDPVSDPIPDAATDTAD